MVVISNYNHEYWGTISGSTIEEVLHQGNTLAHAGVAAIEIRGDLVPENVLSNVLTSMSWTTPTYIAHFGTLKQEDHANAILERVLSRSIQGVICHSRNSRAQRLADLAKSSGKQYAVAYHDQSPLTKSEILSELEYQSHFKPSFRKVALKATSFEDALAIVEAVHSVSKCGGVPVVGAVFGPHRWARIALANAGSAITFIVARRLTNEVGGDDRQFTIDEVRLLAGVGDLVQTLEAK